MSSQRNSLRPAISPEKERISFTEIGPDLLRLYRGKAIPTTGAVIVGGRQLRGFSTWQATPAYGSQRRREGKKLSPISRSNTFIPVALSCGPRPRRVGALIRKAFISVGGGPIAYIGEQRTARLGNREILAFSAAVFGMQKASRGLTWANACLQRPK